MGIELSPADWIQLIIAGTAGAAAVAAILQSKLTKQQMDASLRPWLGIETAKLDDKDMILQFFLKNYGQLPVQSHEIRRLVELRRLSKEEVMEAPYQEENEKHQNFGTVMPNQTKFPVIGIPASKFEIARQGKVQLFIGLQIEYYYANNRFGKFGLIAHIDIGLKNAAIIEEWT